MNSIPYPTHIVAVGAFVKRNDQVLLIRSPKRGWEFPGGQVETGEDLLSAVAREVLEETGITVKVRHQIGLYSNIQTEMSYCNSFEVPTKLMIDFAADYISGDLRTSIESPEVQWCPVDRCRNIVEQDFIKMRLGNMLDFDGQTKYAAYSKTPFSIHCETII